MPLRCVIFNVRTIVMEHFDYWSAFAGTGRVEDYLQYVSHKPEVTARQQTEESPNGTENQGHYYQRANNQGE